MYIGPPYIEPPLYLARTRDPGAMEHIMSNLKTQLERIGVEMSARRHLIPVQNRRKYDIEAKDHFDHLSRAAESGDEKEFARLLERWHTREWYMSLIPHCHLAPPSLVRRNGESDVDYMDRCYHADKELK